MELPISPIQPSSSWPFFLSSPLLFPTYLIPQNYVHWTETPESHLFSADLPGVRKEEIRVEVEDSRYLIIRTERDEESTEPARNFMRKFRLPELIDIDAISAGYEDGVLTVRVPRYFTSRRLRIDPSDLAAMDHLLAPAA